MCVKSFNEPPEGGSRECVKSLSKYRVALGATLGLYTTLLGKGTIKDRNK
tara:strand:+ start:558 stop:707 length:150 start_codon:yes stop_codon:yes gene_type:complete